MDELKYGECFEHPGNSMINCVYCKMETPSSFRISPNDNVLVLGDGILGNEIVKQTNWNYTSRKKDGFNINDPSSWDFSNYKIVINCIANTDTYSNDRDSHWNINYKFVYDLINYCNIHNIKLVHISTEYLYSGSVSNASEEDVPVHCGNWYGYTKLLGDGLVQLISKEYLLIRCMHKKNPFPYDKAWVDQIGNFDYVDVISKYIIDLINFNKSGVYNVGTELKSIYDMAKKTKDVDPILSTHEVPKDISMSVNKLNDIYTPFFSVAIPTYEYKGRGFEFLTHSFKKLEDQTFKNFEVVISDHSLDDGIKKLCDEWANKLKIKYIKNDIGRGIISPNINVAMKNCSGKYIKVLFQDDFLYDSKSLEVTKNFIDQNNGTNWLVSSQYHSHTGSDLYNPHTPLWSDNIWVGNNTIGCPSVLTIKNNDIIYFDESLNWLMDCDYYKRLFDRYGHPKILNEFTVVNRTWGERLTDTMPYDVISKETKMMLDKYL